MSETAEPRLLSSDDTDGVMTALIFCIVGLALSIIGVGIAVWLWRKSVDKRHQRLDEAEKVIEVKEWMYLEEVPDQKPIIRGPLENTIMASFFQAGIITRQTKAKLVFVEEDFKSVGELFPQTGTEFKRAATINRQKSLKGDWHRFSALAKPEGAPLPSINWLYKISDEIHGPFEAGKMRHWFIEGYFSASSPVRMEGHGEDFYTLGEYYPKISDAFSVPPKVLSHMARSSLAGQEKATISTSQRGSLKPEATVDAEAPVQAQSSSVKTKETGNSEFEITLDIDHYKAALDRQKTETGMDNFVQPLLSSVPEQPEQETKDAENLQEQNLQEQNLQEQNLQEKNLQEQPPTVNPEAAVIGRSADEQPANSEQAPAPKPEAKAPGEEGPVKKKKEKKAKEDGEPKKEKKKKAKFADEVTPFSGNNEV